MTTERSLLLRRDVTEALRRGTVPRRGLDLFAVGTERFEGALGEELDRVQTGGSVFKAIRGDFGCGKSFTALWYQQRALEAGFAVAEVQISAGPAALQRVDLYPALRLRITSTEPSERRLRDTVLETISRQVLPAGVSVELGPSGRGHEDACQVQEHHPHRGGDAPLTPAPPAEQEQGERRDAGDGQRRQHGIPRQVSAAELAWTVAEEVLVDEEVVEEAAKQREGRCAQHRDGLGHVGPPDGEPALGSWRIRLGHAHLDARSGHHLPSAPCPQAERIRRHTPASRRVTTPVGRPSTL